MTILRKLRIFNFINWKFKCISTLVYFSLPNFSYRNPPHSDEREIYSPNSLTNIRTFYPPTPKSKSTFVEIFHTQRPYLSSPTRLPQFRSVASIYQNSRQQHRGSSRRGKLSVKRKRPARVSRFRVSVACYIYQAARRGEFAISRPVWLAREGANRGIDRGATNPSLFLSVSLRHGKEAFSLTVASK